MFAAQAFATVNTANVLSLNTATTNVTTSAYVTLTSSVPVTPSQLIVVNGTSSVIKIAIGAAGSEVDFISVGGSGTTIVEQLSKHIVIGSRISVEAISATASSGYISVSLVP
jgi:hypothetical protein